MNTDGIIYHYRLKHGFCEWCDDYAIGTVKVSVGNGRIVPVCKAHSAGSSEHVFGYFDTDVEHNETMRRFNDARLHV